MLEITNRDWEDIDKTELATLTINAHKKFPYFQSERTLDNVLKWLKRNYKRFTQTTFFLAHSNNKLVGWFAVSLNTKPYISETWRWTPHISSSEKEREYEIATGLIKECIEYIKRNNQTRLEVCFDKINDNTFHYYKQYRIWFEAERIHLVDDNAYMRKSLDSKEFTQNDIVLPPGYTYEPLLNANSEALYACYSRCFKESDIRGFHDMTNTERRVDYEHYFEGGSIEETASLVIIKDCEIVGFSLVHARPKEAHLADIGIDPTFRGKSLGKRLLKNSMIKAAQNYNTMTLSVDIQNTLAYSLYKNIGFDIEYRIITHAWKQDGKKYGPL